MPSNSGCVGPILPCCPDGSPRWLRISGLKVERTPAISTLHSGGRVSCGVPTNLLCKCRAIMIEEFSSAWPHRLKIVNGNGGSTRRRECLKLAVNPIFWNFLDFHLHFEIHCPTDVISQPRVMFKPDVFPWSSVACDKQSRLRDLTE